MKELSIEEKAKRYDEAIERANELNYVSDKDSLQRKAVEHIFPELAESEDEKIRKWLICTLKSLNNSPVQIDGAYEMMLPAINWLEKQGEQKPTQEIEPTPIFKIGDILKRKGKDYTFRVDRIQGGYYHCDRNHGAFFPIEEQGNWELVEQKPAWSEEDEVNLNETLFYIKDDALKEFIKSLKDRYTWKPSEEQMITLRHVISGCSYDIEPLVELETKLKEL